MADPVADDADVPSPDRLTVVAFATAHLAAVSLLAILALHLNGSLGDVLASLDTRLGVGLFALVWALALATHRRGFAHADPWALLAGDGAPRRRVGRFLLAGSAWGAVTGGAFALIVVGGFFAGSIVLDPSQLADLFTVVTAYLLLIATGIGLVVGGSIGLCAAVGDAVVLAVVDRIVPGE